jgi:trk system potassium uptake protein TrkH
VSLGLTENLSVAGKFVTMAVMFIGRLGPISVAAAIASVHSEAVNHFDYPEGRVIIG